MAMRLNVFASTLALALALAAGACAQPADDAGEDQTRPDAPAGGETAASDNASGDASGDAASPAAPSAGARAQIITNDRTPVGTATLTQGPEGVVMRLELDGIDHVALGGWHGAHFHEIGDCSSEDFTSSGGHINPDGRRHGLLNPDGPDNADMPNIWIHEDGSVRAEIYSTRVSIDGATDAPALLDADGSAFVMHANRDDQTTQPIGGAGPRILCGVIEAAR